MRKTGSLLPLEAVSRDTLNERIYKELRRALMAGAFQPGQKLSIRALADSLGTSAMPVRDALRRLITERALEGLPNRSIGLPSLTGPQVDEIYKIRVALETLATGEAARRATPADIEEVRRSEEAVAAALEEGAIDQYGDLNWRFHFGIYRLSGMPQLVETIETFWLQIGPLLRHHWPALHAATISDDHHRAVEALAIGDSRKAAAAIAADLNHTWAVLASILRENDEKPTARRGRRKVA